MGPRSCDRGSRESCAPFSSHLPLQWGRGHVTAEVRRRRAHSQHHENELQWGRGHVTAEVVLDRQGASRELSASMGPRSCDRGSRCSTARALRRDGVASMGPRSCDRGSLGGHVGFSALAPRFNGAAVM